MLMKSPIRFQGSRSLDHHH
uniref:Uncharacterized protein n=1 Tax=Rhizophora mucronata TaxID=61149 RepID=A0A2P2JHR1_RHIMU